MSMTPRVLLVSAILCAATACGGDDPAPGASPSATRTTVSEIPSPTPTPMTKAAYAAAVSTICERVESEADKIGEPKTARDYANATTRLVEIIGLATSEVRALIPPPEDAAALEANFLAGNDKQLAAFKAALPEVQSAAQSNDLQAAEKAFGEAITAVDSTDAQDKYLKDYGLGACV